MKENFFRYLPQLIIGLTLYITILCIQWTFETKYTFNTLLQDIISYDTQVIKEMENDRRNEKNYIDIFIPVESMNLGIWLSKWNVFDWGEAKYIYKKNRIEILKNLNYWRETGKLPTMYNLHIKSV